MTGASVVSALLLAPPRPDLPIERDTERCIVAVHNCQACGAALPRDDEHEDTDRNPICGGCAPVDYATLRREVLAVLSPLRTYARAVSDAECEAENETWDAQTTRDLQRARAEAVLALRAAADELVASLSGVAREAAADLRREALLIEGGIWSRHGGRGRGQFSAGDRVDNVERWADAIRSTGDSTPEYIADDRVSP